MSHYVVKMKLGRYYIAKLGLVEVPIGISRLKCGAWSIGSTKFPDVQQRRFYDYDYSNGAIGSLYATLAEVIGEEKKRLRALETEERAIKLMKLDLVGVFYYEVDTCGKHIHRFGVSTPGEEVATKTVYIGNDLTVDANWDGALKKARDLRHAWERQRTIDSYWTGTNVVKMAQPA